VVGTWVNGYRPVTRPFDLLAPNKRLFHVDSERASNMYNQMRYLVNTLLERRSPFLRLTFKIGLLGVWDKDQNGREKSGLITSNCTLTVFVVHKANLVCNFYLFLNPLYSFPFGKYLTYFNRILPSFLCKI